MKGVPSAYEMEIARLTHEFQPHISYTCTHGDRMEIIYLRQGIVSMEIGELTVDARSGAVIIIPANTPHSGTYAASDRSGKFERYTLELVGVCRPGLPEGHLLAAGLNPVVQLDIPHILTAMFQLIEQEFLAREPEWEAVCGSTLSALCTMIVRSAVPCSRQPPPQAQTLAAEILAYLHTHYCENITLQSVADHFYISHYYLSHLMKKHLNISLMQYVLRLRISEAQTLLRDTDYPIRQIAQMVGYQSLNYFSSVFRKTTGISPGECRARSRE